MVCVLVQTLLHIGHLGAVERAIHVIVLSVPLPSGMTLLPAILGVMGMPLFSGAPFSVTTSELLASNVVACGCVDFSWALGSAHQDGLKPSCSVFSSFSCSSFILTRLSFFLFL